MSTPTQPTPTDKHEQAQAREYIFNDVIQHEAGEQDANDALRESVAAAVRRAIDDHETPVEVTLTAEITPHPGGDE